MAKAWQNLSDLITFPSLSCIKELGFAKPTPVQTACIPLFLKNKDVAAEAVTGSGKTLAFLIPVFEMLQRREAEWKKSEIGALIISPTRELATQIYEVVSCFIKHFPMLSSILLTGGKDMVKDDQILKQGGNIVVGTPGRLESLFEDRSSPVDIARRVKSLEVLILDEADRLLDMGFEASINTILKYIPKQRRTGLFSATQTDEIESLIRAGLRNPVRISIKEKARVDQDIQRTPASLENYYMITGSDEKLNQLNEIESLIRAGLRNPVRISIKEKARVDQDIQRTPASLDNYYMITGSDEKLNQLIKFIQSHRKQKIMIFFSTCAGVDYFSSILKHILKNIQIFCIHGKMKKRHGVVSKFKSSPGGILICTDVMARGMDIPEVNWVIQYDPPTTATSFVHRCGRTARSGQVGSALVFLHPEEESFVEFIEINQKCPLTKMEKFDVDNNYLPEVQTLALNDRAMYDKGMRAFVSFVQSYSKHECYMIFQMKKLDFGHLANGFGLLKLPKMPELRGKTVENFSEVPIDVEEIKYRDKDREKMRQKQLQNGELSVKSKKLRRPPRSKAWSNKHEGKRKRNDQNGHDSIEKDKVSEEDLAGLNDEYRMMKKLKKKKMSLEQFDKEFMAEEKS